MVEYCDSFLAKVRKANKNSCSLEITLDYKVVKFEGWKEGDELRIVARKVEGTKNGTKRNKK